MAARKDTANPIVIDGEPENVVSIDPPEGETAHSVPDEVQINKSETEGQEVPEPEPVLIPFRQKTVLSEGEQQKLVTERIKEHETAIAQAELIQFEHYVLGNIDGVNEQEQKIDNSYALVQAYVLAYNARYDKKGS